MNISSYIYVLLIFFQLLLIKCNDNNNEICNNMNWSDLHIQNQTNMNISISSDIYSLQLNSHSNSLSNTNTKCIYNQHIYISQSIINDMRSHIGINTNIDTNINKVIYTTINPDGEDQLIYDSVDTKQPKPEHQHQPGLVPVSSNDLIVLQFNSYRNDNTSIGISSITTECSMHLVIYIGINRSKYHFQSGQSDERQEQREQQEKYERILIFNQSIVSTSTSTSSKHSVGITNAVRKVLNNLDQMDISDGDGEGRHTFQFYYSIHTSETDPCPYPNPNIQLSNIRISTVKNSKYALVYGRYICILEYVCDCNSVYISIYVYLYIYLL